MQIFVSIIPFFGLGRLWRVITLLSKPCLLCGPNILSVNNLGIKWHVIPETLIIQFTFFFFFFFLCGSIPSKHGAINNAYYANKIERVEVAFKVSMPKVDTSSIPTYLRGLTIQVTLHEHINKSKWKTWKLVLLFLKRKWISYESLKRCS